MYAQPSVFMIGWEYPPHNSGGLGVACEGITQALSTAGHHISFTLPYEFTGEIKHMNVLSCIDPSWKNNPNLPPFSMYGISTELHTQRTLNPDDLKLAPQSELEAKVEQYANQVVEKSNNQKQFDVIHAHDWLSFPAAMALKEETGKPFVAHVHSTEFDRIPNGNGSAYITDMELRGMQAADAVIAVSFYTKQLLIKRYNINPAKIAVVHNGILPPQPIPKRVQFAENRPVIVFMGRLTQQKGGQYFLYLAKKVIQQIPNALFVVAGHGDMYQELLLTSAGQQLSAHVMFSGFLRDTQKNMLLDRADAFIMPSISEPFGLVALEAAQRNTPVIVSKTSGVAEVMPDAIAIDFWDVDAMTEQLVKLLTSKGEQKQQIQKQHFNLAALTWESSAKKIQSVYKRAFLGL